MSACDAFNGLAETRYGKVIYDRRDRMTGRSLEVYGEYAEREVVVFDQIVRAGDVVVEVGAGVGAHTLFLARKVGLGGRVFALEPRRLAFQALCGTLAVNSITNAWCWNAAAGARPGEVVLPGDEERAAEALESQLAGERVPVVVLDGMNLPRCDFFKVRVDGTEADVIEGATELLMRLRPAVYVSCEEREASEALLEQLFALGYSLHWHTVPLFNPSNFARVEENVFGEKVARNLLCIDRAAPSRLTGFTPVQRGKAA